LPPRLRERDESLAKECADWKKAYTAMCDDYNADIANLKAELEAARNDLDDALDLKAGHGPTVLTRLVRERDEIKAELEAARSAIREQDTRIAEQDRQIETLTAERDYRPRMDEYERLKAELEQAAERQREYKRLYDLRGEALKCPCPKCGYVATILTQAEGQK